MRISYKLAVIIAVFVVTMAINGLVSLQILSRMGGELKGVVNRDVVLMQMATAITRHQLQKAVVFERIRRIAEELAFQDTVPSRREHLTFHLKLAKDNLDELAKDGALNIVNAKGLVAENQKVLRDPASRDELEKINGVIREIERAHIHYDALIGDIFRLFGSGKYELSPEDIAQIHRDERKLATELENLDAAVAHFMKLSLSNAARYEQTAGSVLWMVLGVSVLAGLLLTIWILNAINPPLKKLVDAAHQIGSGNLDISLTGGARDEFGEVSGAFNKMASRLKESTTKLEEQSQMLKRNLDITEQQKKDLEKVNHELDRFVQTVSHDIRSPLMGVVWYADYLKTHCAQHMDQKGKESLEGVARSVDRANALIRDLLTLTRLSRVRNPYAFVSTKGLLEEVLANLEYKIHQNHVEVRVPPDMPVIFCDGIKIKEVFLNLLTNAIKFSSGEERQPVIEFFYKDTPDAHEFIVKDNGIGIAPEYHDTIFAIFKRLDTSGKYEGTGAGLSIVKSVIDDHGGKVWVTSEVGNGSGFHFTIPKSLGGLPSA